MENFRLISKALPESVENARTIFNSSPVFQFYLNSDLLSYLENLLVRDVEWLRILFNSNENIDKLLNANFKLLAEKLTYFKNIIGLQFQYKTEDFNEPKSRCVQNLDEATYECCICLVVIFDSKASDDDLSSLRGFAIESFSNIRNFFDTVLLTSKLDKLKNYLQMGFSTEIDWARANMYLKEHFYMFIPSEYKKFPGFIHKLFEKELMYNDIISNLMPVTQFESFIKKIFCSLEAFENFLHKNFYYHSFQQKLEDRYIFFAQLQKDYPNKKNFMSKLKIIESRSAKYKDRIFEFDCKGLQRILKEGKEIKFVRRSEPDYLVFIGTDRSSNFLSDIQISIEESPIPNAVVFINKLGLNLIDLSPLWSVKIQFSTKVIEKSMIFVFGRSTFINIQPSTGVQIKENIEKNKKTLILYEYNSSELNFIANNIVAHIVPENEIKIGKENDCQVKLNAADICGTHAIIKLDKKGELFIEDHSNGNSFFLLKNKKQLAKGKTSKFLNLRKNPDFFVKNVRFKLID